MKKSADFRFTTQSMFMAVFFFCFILAAYARGNYLFGVGFGATYAVVASLITMLFLRTLSQSPVRKSRLWFLVLFALPVSLAFAFPTYLNPDNRHFANQQAIDRSARSELATLFARDPAFRQLGVSTTHRKGVTVEIHGSIRTKADLDRLRSDVRSQCGLVDSCFVHWRVYVSGESQTYSGPGDGDLDATSG